MSEMPRAGEPARGARYDWSVFWSGVRGLWCLAGLVMFSSFTGFGALIQSLDVSLAQGLATNVMIFALPGQVVFIDLWRSGVNLFVVGFAVTLTAVRLLPMVVVVLARARVPGLPVWPQFVVAQFTAITTWVIANERIAELQPNARLPWLVGLCLAQVLLICGATVFGFFAAAYLPLPLATALVFLTPCYFLIALFQGAQWRFDYLAIVLGGLFGAVALSIAPGSELVVAGLIGGTLAYILGRSGRKDA